MPGQQHVHVGRLQSVFTTFIDVSPAATLQIIQAAQKGTPPPNGNI